MIEINEQQKQVERERIAAREANIVKNLMKLENWKKDIQMRREKKDTVRFQQIVFKIDYVLHIMLILIF